MTHASIAPAASHEIVEGVVTRMSDGVDLVMDLYVPIRDGKRVAEPLPVIVERTPYDRTASRFRDFGREAAMRGFIFACQDVRGRGDSGGHFHLMTNIPDEGQDGSETLAWVVEQPWCDGRIATVGGSFSAANQQAAALHHPKGLYTQVLRDCGNNYYQRMFRYNGAFNIAVILPWIVNHGAIGHEAQKDPAVKEAFIAMGRDIGQWALRLPLERGNSPLALAPTYEEIYFKMLETSDDVPYWHNVTIRLDGRWDEYPTDLSVMMVSGWFAHHAAANLEKLVKFGERLDGPLRLVMGPWSHGPMMMEEAVDGDVEFGPAALRYAPINAQWLDWIEDRLADRPARQPRLSYFHMGGGSGSKTTDGRIEHGGEWRESDQWPLPNAQFQPLYLSPNGRLVNELPLEGQSRYDYDPADPTPAIGAVTIPRTHPTDFVRGGPRIQKCDPGFPACRGSSGFFADREDVLVFDTDPLEEAVDVTGPITARLWVSSSARDTDFAAQLVDVYPPSEDFPDGCPLLITEGILRMRYRNRQAVAELIEPGQIYPIEIELGPTSNRFAKGHRIRLTLCSARFPQYDVNPNTGEALGCATRLEIARQTIWHGEATPSCIVIPKVVTG